MQAPTQPTAVDPQPTHYLIVNPRAGNGRARRWLPRLTSALRTRGVPFVLAATRGPGSAAVLAYQACAAGYHRVVVVGGDGTLHEAANGLLHYAAQHGQAAALGLVPLGTGNDFCKSLPGWRSNDLAGALARLVGTTTRHVDVARVEVQSALGTRTAYMLNNLALGIDAHVGAGVLRMPYVRGTLAYLLAAVQALRTYQAQPVAFTLDHSSAQTGRYLLATVANGRCQGGGFWLTPQARLDDGQLDLCLVAPLRPYELVHYVPRALWGAHTHLPQVQMARARTVSVQYAQPALVVADGEVLATEAKAVRLTVMPGALALIG